VYNCPDVSDEHAANQSSERFVATTLHFVLPIIAATTLTKFRYTEDVNKSSLRNCGTYPTWHVRTSFGSLPVM